MMYVKRCMIVTAANQAFAQSLCVGIAGQSGKDMFISGLSSTGLLPATHYITEGMVHDNFATLMTDANALYTACQIATPPVITTLAQCQNLLAQSDLSTDNPFVAMTRLGLKKIS